MTWTADTIAAFEAGIHPSALCPVGGCAQCHDPRPAPPRPTDRTAHRAICVDDEGYLDCVCELAR